MSTVELIGVMIAVCVLVVLFLFFTKQFKFASRIVLNGAVGGAGILIMNFLLAPIGMMVGLNALTVFIAGFLGAPGFILLYVTQFILN